MQPLPVRRLELPTPYAVGPVNAYLIEAEPTTLIDCGVNTPEAQNALLIQLNAAGYFPQSIEQILVTHAHPDHYGLVHVVQELSGATVYFPEREIMRVRDQQMVFEVGRLLVEAGMPLDLLFKMDQQRKKDPNPGIDHDSVVPVKDGDVFEFKHYNDGHESFTLVAHNMPGHTGGHMVYLDPERGALFAGDQLLPKTSPNPLLEPSLDEPGTRRRSLHEYLRSLEAMGEMDLTIAYPGHGEPITDPPALIRRTLLHHDKRKGVVASLLDDEPKSPYDVATTLYPSARGYDVFLSVSEVIAHLDLVVDDGRARTEERDGVTYYRSAGVG